MGRVIPLGEKTSARLMYSDKKGIAMAQAATVSTLLGVAALAAGMMVSSPAQAQATEEPARECVRILNINGYSSLDDQHLLLNSGASRHYLVTTRRSCYGLEHGMQVGLSFPDRTRICNASIEYVVVPNGGRCRIESIEEVEDAEMARALIAERSGQDTSSDR